MEKIKRNAAPIILLLLFAMYFVVLFQITIFRDSNFGVRIVNIIPFVTIVEYFQFVLSGNRITGILNIAGNLIIFLPLGYMTAVLFPKMRKLTRIFVLASAFSLVIEIFQYVFMCGRADIDDVLLNTLGGVIGYWAFVIVSRLLKPEKYVILTSALMVAVLCIGFTAFNNYKFLLPARNSPRNLTALIDAHSISSEPLIITEMYEVHFFDDAVINYDYI